MGLLDLRVETSILNRTLRGARVLNVYDAQNGRTYVLKLSIPPLRGENTSSSSTQANNPESSSSVSQSWEKRLLLLESGSRIHITQYDREKDVPSGFCVKLRKHIRGRRLDKVVLLGDGGDRIIDLVFSGEGAIAAHLIVEGFSGGNVILTDAEYTILTLLRIDRTKGDGEDGIVAVRERYPAEKARKRTVVEKAEFEAAMERAVAAIPDEKALQNVQGKHAKKKMQAMLVARKALAYELAIEPSFLEHAIRAARFDPDISLRELHGHGAGPVYQNLQELEETLSKNMSTGSVNGYIILSNTEKDDKSKEVYADFTPFLFKQYENKPYKQFSTFDEAVDEYFSRIETQRADTAQAKREALAFKKVDKLASGLEGQVKIFENARDLSGERAKAIEANILEVDAAVKVLNSAIAASVPWDGLAKMVQDEKKNGNPIAQLIHSLQLEKNQITLRLQCPDEESVERDEEETGSSSDKNDDGDNEQTTSRSQRSNSKHCSDNDQKADKARTILVPIDLNLGAHANARRHYEQQKNATAKMQKAVEVTDKTIKAASKKAASEAHKLEQEAIVASIKARRVPLWFEKFYWFASSENYLVVAGRDSQQNELLVKRYMGPADIYVNADLEGASSVIVKNYKHPGSHSYDEIPQVTLEQAGAFAMCRSSAWEGKFVTSAWWVRAGQVSKTIPSGEYLPGGSFFIRGKKNFLNPTQLVMGIAFMFRVDDSCIEYHKGERCIRNIEEDNGKGKSQHSAQNLLQTQDSAYSSSVSPGIDNLVIKIHPSSTQVDEEQQLSMKSTPGSVEQRAEADISSSGNEGAEEKIVSGGSVAEQKEQLNELQSQKPSKATKKYLSAKERRLRKQGRNLGTERIACRENQLPEDLQNTKKQAGPSGSSTTATKAPIPLPRGKKHKLKKMRKKYMDQDEEERRIALELLGSKPVKEMSPGDKLVEEPQSSTSDEEKEEEEASQVAQKPRRKRIEKQEGLRLSNPEGLKELEKLEEDCIYILDTLTALPREDDVIRYALPVCAPYNAVANYRYRVKLMPGTTRRGKGYRAAVAVMLREAEKDLSRFKQERDSMRLTPETEGIHMMVGNVKLMARGLAEVQKSISKTSKKKS